MKNNRSPHRPRLDGPIVIGRNAVREVVLRAPDRLVKVFTTESLRESRDELLKHIESLGVSLENHSRDSLTSATGTDSHQGIAAILKPREHPELREFLDAALAKPRSLIVLLDSIYDPHNLGAILRACECFGVDGIIMSKNRGTGITATVTKSSAGASEFVPICIVSNLAQALGKAKDAGFTGIAADVGAGTEDLGSFGFPQYSALILGSEGEGIQPLLRKLCSRAITIRMSGAIDSLNVSQAAAVLFFAWSGLNSAEEHR